METIEKNLKSGTKIAWLFIIFGLFIGGIIAISQTPPPSAAGGYTLSYSDTYRSEHHVVIHDINNDGIDDIYYWINPEVINSSENSQNIDLLNNTARSVIISGKDGNILRKLDYIGEETWKLSGYSSNNIFRTSDNDIILCASIGKRANDPNFGLYYENNPYQFHLLRIDIDTLEIEKTANVTENNWESLYGLEESAGIYFTPDLFYLKDLGINAPGAPGKTDFLVYQSGFTFEHSGNYSISFIDPETFETISMINMSSGGPIALNDEKLERMAYGFCKGPLNNTEENWDYPYFYTIYRNSSSLNPKVNSTFNLYLAPVSALKNVSMLDDSDWLIKNASIITLDFDDFPDFMDPLSNVMLFDAIEVTLSLNSTENVAGATCHLLRTNRDDLSLSVGLPQGGYNYYNRDDSISMPSFNLEINADNPNIELPIFSIVASFHIDYSDNENAQKTFEYGGLSPLITDQYSSILGINHPTNEGICIGTVPVRISDDGNTSVALIFSKQRVNYIYVDDIEYPFVYNSITFLPGNLAGLYLNSTIVDINDLDYVYFECTNRLQYFYNNDYQYLNDITYDVDGDGLTDIPILGTTRNEDQLLKFYDDGTKYANGPYFSVTQQGNVNQTLYVYFSEYWIMEEFTTLSDINNDGASDLMIGNNFVFFSTSGETEEQEEDFFNLRLGSESTRGMFILGVVMIVISIALLVIIMVKMKGVNLKMNMENKKRVIILSIIALLGLFFLYSQLGSIIENVTDKQGTQIGTTPELLALSNLQYTSGIATFVLFTFLPVTAGIYILLTPKLADRIIALNQIRFTKKAGLDAAIKKEQIDEEAVAKSSKLNYKVVIVPPFGRKASNISIVSRILSIMALSISIGLYAFDYGLKLLDTYDISDVTVLTGLTDVNFTGYISSMFIFLIIPGIIAVPLFFWLIPTSWLLDDSGVLFYKKKLNNRSPEDIEPIGGWFSNYLKGFLGIGAIMSYIGFIQDSIILSSISNFNSSIQSSVLVFVFGFILVSGLAFGVITSIMHEVTLPYNAGRLYDLMDKRNMDIVCKNFTFIDMEKLTYDVTVSGFTGKGIRSVSEVINRDESAKSIPEVNPIGSEDNNLEGPNN